MAAVDYFLKLDGIEGESADDKHKNEIELDSFSWGATQQGTAGTHTGAGAGKVNMQDIHFTSKLSKASPKLALAVATGQAVKEATLTVRKAGGKQEEYFTIKLSDTLVSSYQTGGSGHGDVVPVDQFSLNFAKIEIKYKPQQKDGSLGADVLAGYDVAANKKL